MAAPRRRRIRFGVLDEMDLRLPRGGSRRPIRLACARCGEVEYDERRETGCHMEVEICADGEARCPNCADVWNAEHKCYVCEDICIGVKQIEGEPVCEECAELIKSGDQDSPAEIKAELLADARGITW